MLIGWLLPLCSSRYTRDIGERARQTDREGLPHRVGGIDGPPADYRWQVRLVERAGRPSGRNGQEKTGDRSERRGSEPSQWQGGWVFDHMKLIGNAVIDL